jgi:hypothetical protein
MEMNIVSSSRSSIMNPQQNMNDTFFNDTKEENVLPMFTPDDGRKLIQVFSLIFNTQEPLTNYILNYSNELINEENIMLFIQYGLVNGYIKRVKKYCKIQQVNIPSSRKDIRFSNFSERLKRKMDGSY